MAKTGMLCPFSGKLCVDCSVYRGRHYYLCFCENYRGYLPGSQTGRSQAALDGSKMNFDTAPLKPKGAIDPFPQLIKELKERRQLP